MPFKCQINGVDVSTALKQIDIDPGGDGITGVGRLYFDEALGGLDLRNMHDVKVWQTFNAAGAGIAAKGRLFGGHVNMRDTGNQGTTKLWRLTAWDYNIVLSKGIVRDVGGALAISLTADTFANQIATLGDVLQYNGHGFGSPPPVLIDWSTGVEDLYSSMPAVVMEGGHNAAWYIQYLCNTAQLFVPALRPHFYLGTGTTFGIGDTFGNPVLQVYDGASIPAVSVSFSDAPTGGEKPLFGTFRRVDDSTVIVQRRQSVWNNANILTGQDDPSQSTYGDPYINHDGAGGTDGYWMDQALTDTNSKNPTEAQAAMDRMVATTANPKETFEWETPERVMPGDVVELTWALEGISAVSYRVAKVKMIIEDPDVIWSKLTVNNRRLRLFDTGLEEINGLPVEKGVAPPLPSELQNGSFENVRADVTPLFWQIDTVGAGVGRVDTTTAADGVKSFHFYTPTPSDEVLLTSDIFGVRYLDSGDAAELLFLDLKMKRGAHNVNAIDIYVDWYDDTLSIVDTETVVSGLNLLTTWSSYHYDLSWPGSSPEDVVGARLRFHAQPMSGAYDWWIDALTVSRLPGGTVRQNSGSDIGTRARLNFIEGPGIQITTTDDPTNHEVLVHIETLPNPGAGTVSGYRDEVTPTAAATTVTLTYAPYKMMTVARNGVEQSSALGHWSLSGSTLTFTDAFDGTDEVVAAYLIGGVTPISPPTIVVSNPGDEVVLSLGVSPSYTTPPTDWQLPAFDDSLWSLSSSATGGFPPVTGSTRIWDSTQNFTEHMLVRRHFTLPSGIITSARIYLRIDNITDGIYINGVFLGNITDPASFETVDTVFAIPVSALVTGGDNVLAILAEDIGSGGWVSFRIDVS